VSAPPVLADYDFPLPPDRIAQHPATQRDGARLLRMGRSSGELADHHVRELPDLLAPGDLVVVNATRVERARLRGHKTTGGAAEALILGPTEGDGRYHALVRCGGRLRPGQGFRFERAGHVLDADIVALGDGPVVLAFPPGCDPHALGEMPLPPYIRRDRPEPEDEERYQTVFARVPGSVAAPTAGLHLTPALLAGLSEREIDVAEVVLHVGAGTFRPLGEEELRTGQLHAERFRLPEATAEAVSAARARGGRVVAVGTTTTRVLESCATPGGDVTPGEGETRLFLKPGDPIRVVDGLLTNFHLPRSSLLLLVAALVGRERILVAYREAIARGYRFYSYGDAMLIL